MLSNIKSVIDFLTYKKARLILFAITSQFVSTIRNVQKIELKYTKPSTEIQNKLRVINKLTKLPQLKAKPNQFHKSASQTKWLLQQDFESRKRLLTILIGHNLSWKDWKVGQMGHNGRKGFRI